MGFSQIQRKAGDWRATITGITTSEAQKGNIDLILNIASSHGRAVQIKGWHSFIGQSIDVISFSPALKTGRKLLLREPKETGLPEVITFRSVDVSDIVFSS